MRIPPRIHHGIEAPEDPTPGPAPDLPDPIRLEVEAAALRAEAQGLVKTKDPDRTTDKRITRRR